MKILLNQTMGSQPKAAISKRGLIRVALILVSLSVINSGCQKHPDEFFKSDLQDSHNRGEDKFISEKGLKQTNLVADFAGLNAARIDTNLTNAWGIAINPVGILWISSNGKGRSVVYDKNGVTKRPPVGISDHGLINGGNPSGVVFNSTADFIIPATKAKSKFIFAGESGKIYAWSSGDSTRIVADRSSSGAVYKGIEIANDGGANFLYATNFHAGTVDVFDNNFNYINTKPFNDPGISAGFAPFNIRLINNKLFVTYAKLLAPANHDDEKGPGNGYVNIFKTNGSLVRRFVTRGKLNSPWGIEKAPAGFGLGDNIILIGNFGDGRITAFDLEEGEFETQLTLKNTKMPLSIDGLWAITFPDGNIPGDNPNKLYFTAGPNGESNGLFGYLAK
jgi:uncharacterized protein (TIGR03118 family)